MYVTDYICNYAKQSSSDLLFIYNNILITDNHKTIIIILM